MSLSYSELRDGVAGDIAGIRIRNILQPLGGSTDKVFPPTYSVPESARTSYAIENRIIPDQDHDSNRSSEKEDREGNSVVLDSVASQANRLELALLEAIRQDSISVPVTSADFSSIPGLEGLGKISDYEAPHRIFDALLRDSYDGDHLFRNGSAGTAVTNARPRDAAGLFHHSPHTLVFGGWDSTGPRGGLGAKYERALTSEIVALDIRTGKKTGSRIDPTGIGASAAQLFEMADGTWTLDSEQAIKDSGKPRIYGSKNSKKDAGRPSRANLGNVTPSIDAKAGGITAREIVGTTVLSLIQLRRLRFPTLPDGSPVEAGRRAAAELAARTALAALGLAATALAFEEGLDLRSRCVLVMTGPSVYEAVGRSGSVTTFDLDAAEALKLVAEASEHARAAGMTWRAEELTLRPSDRLADLIRRSHNLAAGDEPDKN